MKTNAIVLESRKVSKNEFNIRGANTYSFDIYLFNSLGSVEMFYSSLRTVY